MKQRGSRTNVFTLTITLVRQCTTIADGGPVRSVGSNGFLVLENQARWQMGDDAMYTL